ncbi:hypothetical protein [Archangium sp.]|uniref:hypothetical protein n=1 Tax=Archangium sp. TaxID=1872627 RepID=UPI002D40A0D2|nr:hypothetical protein [Archangium sp.]HYO54431.1 hypothetical protein [Archangium sp.]
MNTRAGIINIDVSFREVNRLIDLIGDRELVSRGSQPVVADRLLGLLDGPMMQRYGFPPLLDEEGKPFERNERLTRHPGAYRWVRTTDGQTFRRTFVRAQSQAISNRRVYVLGGEGNALNTFRLEHELAFTNGTFRRCELGSAKSRAPIGPEQARLPLELLSVREDGPVVRSYYVHLAPFPLPPEVFEALRATSRTHEQLEVLKAVLRRSSLVMDPFWTDLYPHGDQASARPVRPGDSLSAQSGLLVHLVDPFRETLLRREAFLQVLEEWHQRQESLARDEKYLLAKRIETLVHGNQELRATVDERLSPYLVEKERESTKRLLLAELRGADLVRWIGQRQQVTSARSEKGPPKAADTWVILGEREGYVADAASPHEREPHSPYSDTCWHYRTAPEREYADMMALVSAALEGLNETGVGRSFLDRLLNQGLSASWADADAGTKALFEASRKGTTGAIEGLDGILQHLAPQWQKRFKTRTPEAIEDFLWRKHGIRVELLPNRKTRRAVIAKYRGEHRRAEQSSPKIIELPSRGEELVGASKNAITKLSFALESINFVNAVGEVMAKPDLWNILNSVGSACDTLDTMFFLPEGTVPDTVKLASGPLKGVSLKPLGVIGSAVDTTLAARDLLESRNIGSSVGHGMRTLGAALSLGGAFSATSGVGAVVAVVGLGLQCTGSFVVSNFGDAALFLRHCTWGTGENWADKAVSTITQRAASWSDTPLSALAADVPAQQRALDRMFYDFEPTLLMESAEDGGRFLKLQAKLPDGAVLAPDSGWALDVRLVHYLRGTPTTSQVSFLSQEEAALLSKGEVVSLKHWPDAACDGVLTVTGTIELDIAGDGRRKVRKPIDSKFSFELPVPLSRMR